MRSTRSHSPAKKSPGEHLGNIAGVEHQERAHDVVEFFPQQTGLAEVAARLFADRHHADLFPLAFVLPAQPVGRTEDIRVEAAGKSAVRGDDDQRHGLDLALFHQGQAPRFALAAPGQLLHDVGEFRRVGAKVFHPLLGAAKLRRGHHVHGLGYLGGFADAFYFVFDILESRHELYPQFRFRLSSALWSP